MVSLQSRLYIFLKLHFSFVIWIDSLRPYGFENTLASNSRGFLRLFDIGEAKKNCTIMFGWSKRFCFRVPKSDYVISYYVIANFVFQKTDYFTIPQAQKGILGPLNEIFKNALDLNPSMLNRWKGVFLRHFTVGIT